MWFLGKADLSSDCEQEEATEASNNDGNELLNFSNELCVMLEKAERDVLD